MSIDTTQRSVGPTNPTYTGDKPPHTLHRWLCSWQFLVVHAVICFLFIAWTNYQAGLSSVQDGTNVYGLLLYHILRVVLVVYAPMSLIIACMLGLKGLMSCKAVSRSLGMCAVIFVIWVWSVVFVPLIRPELSFFSQQRVAYTIDDDLYVAYIEDGRSGIAIYSLYQCDQFELVCTKVGTSASFTVRTTQPIVKENKQQQTLQFTYDGTVEVEFALPARSP